MVSTCSDTLGSRSYCFTCGLFAGGSRGASLEISVQTAVLIVLSVQGQSCSARCRGSTREVDLVKTADGDLDDPSNSFQLLTTRYAQAARDSSLPSSERRPWL